MLTWTVWLATCGWCVLARLSWLVLIYCFSAVEIVNGISWTSALDKVFNANRLDDPTLSWQYFGLDKGFLRIYPGKHLKTIVNMGSYWKKLHSEEIFRQISFWFTKNFKGFTKFQPFEDVKILIFSRGGAGTKFCSKDM